MVKIRNNILIIYPSIMVTILIIVSTLFCTYTALNIRRNKIKEFQLASKTKSTRLVETLHSIENDITSLGKSVFLLNLLDAIEGDDAEAFSHRKYEVELQFKIFAESRSIYDQIRFIDTTGQEIVRADLLFNGHVDIVSQEELQNRSQRYYFKEAIKLDEGNVYISELDLNMEESEIQTPHKPMLRFAIPVFHKEHKVKGVLVLNVLADKIVKSILTDKHPEEVNSFLLDRNGFYLLHPEISKQWGGPSDLGTGENLSNTVPVETASIILSGQTGIELVNKQYYVFTPIHFDPFGHERYWVLVNSFDKLTVHSPIYIFFAVVGVLNLILMAGIIVLSYIFSNRLVNPLRALVSATRQITDGGLEHAVTINRGNNDIVELTDSFGLMVKKLKESREDNEQLFMKVKEGRDEWQNTFDVITDIIAIHDKDFRIVRANKAFFKKFNVSKEELHDKKCHEIFHGIDGPWFRCPLAKTAESLQPECVEVVDPNMGGAFMVSTYPILDGKGKFSGVVHQARDITDRKKIFEEVRIGKEYTENLLEAAQDAIICIDKNGVISVWNQSAEKIFGYKMGEMAGQSIDKVVPVSVLSGYLQMSKLIKISKVLEVSALKQDGTMIPIEMSLSSQEVENGEYIFTLIVKDATFQKAAKKQLIEKADMLTAVNKELEEFVYIVSHDLKEPLFVIEGYTSRLYNNYKDVYDDKAKHYIDRIKINVKKMSQKIMEIMDVLKVGRISCDFKNNDSGRIVNDVIDSMKERVNNTNIKIIIDKDLPTVFCDEERMKDAFSNLIINAIKFMGNGKHAETPHNLLATEKNNGSHGEIKIGCHTDKDYYKFFVEDTGIGIRKEYQEQVFQIFKRLNDVETEGTGVGLAIVKKVIGLHSGRLWIESPVENGKGSRFCFTIPK
ncbi:MAG: PAS domain S-box protein, partial [Candidatus Scalindua sp.]|nr:PAS domain S-box protein [Candidatus Scalindua sp.]